MEDNEEHDPFADFHLEDLTKKSKKKKKKLNSKDKGNRAELELAKMLTNRFGKTFSKSMGSGNRWSHVNHLPSHAKTTFLGDLCPPEGFKWVIESKNGYEKEIDLNSVMTGKNKQLDIFISQAIDESNRSERKPIIMWKRSRKPWLTFLKDEDLPNHERFKVRMYYNGWVCILLEELLKSEPDDFWFEESDGNKKHN